MLNQFGKENVISKNIEDFMKNKKSLLIERLKLIKLNRIKRYEIHKYRKYHKEPNQEKIIINNELTSDDNQSNKKIMDIKIFNKLPLLTPREIMKRKISFPTIKIKHMRTDTDVNILEEKEYIKKKTRNQKPDEYIGKVIQKIDKDKFLTQKNLVSFNLTDKDYKLEINNHHSRLKSQFALIDYTSIIDNKSNDIIKIRKNRVLVDKNYRTLDPNDKLYQSLSKMVNAMQIKNSRESISRSILSRNILSKSQKDVINKKNQKKINNINVIY